MGFRLTPRSLTLDDLELLQGQILAEFCVISRLGRQLRLNERRWTYNVSDGIVAH